MKSPIELRRAALTNGWESDPLARDILATLENLEGRATECDAAKQAADKAQVGLAAALASRERSTRIAWLCGTLSIVSVLGAGGVALALNNRLTANQQEYARTLAAKDQELTRITTAHEAEVTRLKEVSAAQLSAAAKDIEAALKSAGSIAKSNEIAADSNRAGVSAMLTQFEKMLEQATNAHPSPSAGTPPLTNEKPPSSTPPR